MPVASNKSKWNRGAAADGTREDRVFFFFANRLYENDNLRSGAVGNRVELPPADFNSEIITDGWLFTRLSIKFLRVGNVLRNVL